MLILASASPRRRELLTQAGYKFQIHPAHIPEDPHPNEDPIAYVTRLARQKAEAVYNEIVGKETDAGAPGLDDRGPQRQVFVVGVEETWESTTPNQQPLVVLGADTTLTPDNQIPGKPAGAPGLASETWESTTPNQQPFVVLGADTTLTPDNQIPGKPAGAPGLASETWESTPPDQQPLIVLGADTTVTLDSHILGKPENPEDAARMLRLLSGRTHRVITGVSLVSANRTETAAEVTAVQFLTISEAEIQAYIATGEPNDKAGAYAIQGHAARWIPRIEGCYFNVVGLPIALVSTLLDQML